jgi:hypothetical protein
MSKNPPAAMLPQSHNGMNFMSGSGNLIATFFSPEDHRALAA